MPTFLLSTTCQNLQEVFPKNSCNTQEYQILTLGFHFNSKPHNDSSCHPNHISCIEYLKIRAIQRIFYCDWMVLQSFITIILQIQLLKIADTLKHEWQILQRLSDRLPDRCTYAQCLFLEGLFLICIMFRMNVGMSRRLYSRQGT